MDGRDLIRVFQNSGTIASIHNEEGLFKAITNEKVQILFLMNGDLLTMAKVVNKIHAAGKKVFSHVDFIKGLNPDSTGMKFVSDVIKPDGIISTRGNVIQNAKKYDLMTVQRLFLIDSHALASGVKSIHTSSPDAVEAMPGLIPRVIKELTMQTTIPVISGGLFKTKEEMLLAREAGAMAVSSGNPELW